MHRTAIPYPEIFPTWFLYNKIIQGEMNTYKEILADDFVIHYFQEPDLNSQVTLKQSSKEASVEMPDYYHAIKDTIARVIK